MYGICYCERRMRIRSKFSSFNFVSTGNFMYFRRAFSVLFCSFQIGVGCSWSFFFMFLRYFGSDQFLFIIVISLIFRAFQFVAEWTEKKPTTKKTRELWKRKDYCPCICRQSHTCVWIFGCLLLCGNSTTRTACSTQNKYIGVRCTFRSKINQSEKYAQILSRTYR